MDNSNINIRPRYIRSAANIWAGKLSRHLDSDDWQLDPLVFHEMDTQFGPNKIDRFASALNTLMSRYNAQWLDKSREAVASLQLYALARRKQLVQSPMATIT